MLDQKKKVILGKLLLIASLVFFIIGIKNFISINNFKSENEKIFAKVTDSNKENKFTSVSFYLGDKEYKTVANEYDANYKVGDEIEIFYKKDEPNVIILKDTNQGYLVPFVAAICSIIVGLSFSVQKGNNVKKNLQIKQNGKRIEAEIIKVMKNSRTKVNGVNPYYVVCKWTNKKNGHEYLFNSDDVWYNPNEQLVKAGITKVPVYVNPQNPQEYYVDLEEVNTLNSGFTEKKPK